MALLLYHVLCVFVVSHAVASVRARSKIGSFSPCLVTGERVERWWSSTPRPEAL